MIQSLQYLRALAALVVVYLHLSGQIQRHAEAALPWDGVGNAGVGLFFVISGFIMWVNTHGRPWTAREFLTRRVMRIVPLYWIVTTLVVAVAAVAPRALSSTALEPGHAIASYLFVAHAHPIFTDQFWPILIPGWSLNYEMFFYVLFGLTLGLGRAASLTTTVGLLAALVAWGAWAAPAGVVRFYTDPILLEFAAGMLAGLVYTAGVNISPAVSATMLVLGAAGLFLAPALDLDVSRVLAFGLPSVLLVLGAAVLERSRRCVAIPGARLLGDASYSIYLTHPIAVAVLAKGWTVAGLGWGLPNILAFTLAGLAGACAVGLASYVLIEKPIIAFFRARRTPPALMPAE